MAVDAVVPYCRSAASVPIAAHPAMGAAFPVTGLRAVALGAEANCVGHVERLTPGEPESVGALGVMAVVAIGMILYFRRKRWL